MKTPVVTGWQRELSHRLRLGTRYSTVQLTGPVPKASFHFHPSADGELVTRRRLYGPKARDETVLSLITFGTNKKWMLRVGQGPPPWGNMGQRPPAGAVLMAFTATCIL